MKIRLLVDIPIEAKHGATKGRVFDVIRRDRLPKAFKLKRHRFWFMGDVGRECAAFGKEVEILEES